MLIEADVGLTLTGVQDKLNGVDGWNGAPSEWLENLREQESRKEGKNTELMAKARMDGGYWNPLSVLSQLEDV